MVQGARCTSSLFEVTETADRGSVIVKVAAGSAPATALELDGGEGLVGLSLLPHEEESVDPPCFNFVHGRAEEAGQVRLADNVRVEVGDLVAAATRCDGGEELAGVIPTSPAGENATKETGSYNRPSERVGPPLRKHSRALFPASKPWMLPSPSRHSSNNRCTVAKAACTVSADAVKGATGGAAGMGTAPPANSRNECVRSIVLCCTKKGKRFKSYLLYWFCF